MTTKRPAADIAGEIPAAVRELDREWRRSRISGRPAANSPTR